jgi:hypothetical protein
VGKPNKTGAQLFEVTEDADRMTIRSRPEPYRAVLNVLTWLCIGATGVFLAYLFATRENPGYWWLAPVPFFLVLFVAAKAADLRAAARVRTFAFDRRANTVMQNEIAIGSLPHIDQVLVREIVQEGRPSTDYALVIAFDDTRRATIAEAVNIPNGCDQVEAMARKLAAFLDVRVEHGVRHPEDSWMDQ